MALKITDPADKTSRTEILGGAAISFVRGSAHVTGWRLRASVAAACRRRGYRVEFDRHRKPAPAPVPAPAPDVVDEAPDVVDEEPAVVETPDGVEHVGILPASAAEPSP